jgi:hypothetical protein
MTDHGDMHFCISLFLLLEALGFELVLPRQGLYPLNHAPNAILHLDFRVVTCMYPIIRSPEACM